MAGGVGARHLEYRVLMGGKDTDQMPCPYGFCSPFILFPFPSTHYPLLLNSIPLPPFHSSTLQDVL